MAPKKADDVRNLIQEMMPMIREEIQQQLKSTGKPVATESVVSSEADMNLDTLLDTAASANGEQPSSFISSIPLGATLSNALKAKIIEGKYIDFASLLGGESKEKLTLSVGKDNELSLKTNSGNLKITSFDQWLKCFLIYSSVYAEAHPEDALGLFKYCYTVREIFSKYGGNAWLLYDSEFRKLRQGDQAISWGLVHVELELSVTAPSRRQTQMPGIQGNFRAFKNNTVPKSYCFRFHGSGSCNRGDKCLFKHTCYKCQQEHSSLFCNNQATTKPHQQKQAARADNNTNKLK